MSFLKERLTYLAISVLLIAIGVVTLVFQEITLDILCYLLGASILFIGITKIVLWFLKSGFRFLFQFDLGQGIFLTVLGILMLLNTNGVKTALPIILGLLWFVDGIIQFNKFIALNKVKSNSRYALLIFAILTCALGIVLMIDPFTERNAFMIFTGVTFIIDGVQNLIYALFFKKFTQEKFVEQLDDDTTMYY